MAAEQKHEFQAEARQLLDLVIHALYSHKEIFLRELVSNASDALDRLRFEALTKPELLGEDDELSIRLEVDRDARTLTIHDNGIGMSRDEVVENIGTIARSGTRELMKTIRESKQGEVPPELIGQFGVGFYSAFMVADQIVLTTRRAGEEAGTKWESSGDGGYSVSDSDREERGTSITLHLKPSDQEDGLEDFTDRYVLGNTIRNYSDFVTYPITLAAEPDETKSDDAAKETEDADKTDDAAESDDAAETASPSLETLNSMKAIWMRPASEVTEEEYVEFYKHISHDWSDPLARITLSAEGTFEYKALVYIPGRAAFDLWMPESKPGLQLYVKRVRIDEHCEHLVPRYLRFLKGVVDAPDLALNVSREMLQHDRRINQVRRRVTKKVLSALEEIRDDDKEKYLKIWTEFGRALKEGVATDDDHRDRLTGLLLLASSNHDKDLTSLGEYVARMKDEQEEIYYLTGPSRTVVESSPHLEAIREKGYEVLFLVDPIDEIIVQHMPEFDSKKLRSAGKGVVETGTDEDRKQEKEERETKQKEHASLLEFLQKKLDDRVSEVRLSGRLSSSPVCLVGGENDMSPQLEFLLRQNQAGMPKQKRILELNPDHPILEAMQARYDKDRGDEVLADYAELLFGQALLAEGGTLEDPTKFSRLVAKLMVMAG